MGSHTLVEKIRDYRKDLHDTALLLTTGPQAQFDALTAEDVSEEVIQKRMRQNETEMKNWLN